MDAQSFIVIVQEYDGSRLLFVCVTFTRSYCLAAIRICCLDQRPNSIFDFSPVNHTLVLDRDAPSAPREIGGDKDDFAARQFGRRDIFDGAAMRLKHSSGISLGISSQSKRFERLYAYKKAYRLLTVFGSKRDSTAILVKPRPAIAKR
jgi:hypothetical protein